MVQEATQQREGKTSVAELELSILEQLKSYAAEHHSLLIVSWSEDGESYRWLQSWATQQGIAFADWAPKAAAVRVAMPALALDNQHSGGHHRGWTNLVIAKEFARQIRAPRP
jgi:ABC-type proline/glycine betaine transport system substrate-binding protein